MSCWTDFSTWPDDYIIISILPRIFYIYKLVFYIPNEVCNLLVLFSQMSEIEKLSPAKIFEDSQSIETKGCDVSMPIRIIAVRWLTVHIA